MCFLEWTCTFLLEKRHFDPFRLLKQIHFDSAENINRYTFAKGRHSPRILKLFRVTRRESRTRRRPPSIASAMAMAGPGLSFSRGAFNSVARTRQTRAQQRVGSCGPVATVKRSSRYNGLLGASDVRRGRRKEKATGSSPNAGLSGRRRAAWAVIGRAVLQQRGLPLCGCGCALSRLPAGTISHALKLIWISGIIELDKATRDKIKNR
jgi:hypothetical protein